MTDQPHPPTPEELADLFRLEEDLLATPPKPRCYHPTVLFGRCQHCRHDFQQPNGDRR